MTKWAKVTTRFTGFHKWPEAPPSVVFLSHLHRHVFHVTVWLEVFHNDREVEYFELQRKLEALLEPPPFMSRSSCEDMAEWILHALRGSYERTTTLAGAAELRRCKVEVLEDGENGALIESD